MKTDIWPACQFNFNWLDDNPTRALTDSDKQVLESNIPFTGGGLVNIQFLSRRLIITTTVPQNQQEEYQGIYQTRLINSLHSLGILRR